MKKHALQIRLENALSQSFSEQCNSEGKQKADVVRRFMKMYAEYGEALFQDLAYCIGNKALIEQYKSNKNNEYEFGTRVTQENEDPSVIHKVGELYSGPGGLGLAASLALVRRDGKTYKLSHAWASDYDEDSCETYRKNVMPDSFESVICSDVRTLDISNLAPIDGFMYGFPCNDFSIVGESKGFEGEFGPLYTYGVKVLDCHRPKWFLAENVGGISSANDGLAFKKILADLSAAGENGYSLTVHKYKFEEYGIPQARHRLIVIGLRTDLGLKFEVPAPTNKTTTSREAIDNPPISGDAHNHEYTKQSANVIERLKHIKPGQNAWNADLPEHLQLNVKTTRLSHIYKRLDPDKPAYTITGSGGGGTHMYHWDEPRALTNRERARLQTFPDDFLFSGSKESVRKQLGMAVPVKGAQIILEAVLKTFAGQDYESVSPNIGYFRKNIINQPESTDPITAVA